MNKALAVLHNGMCESESVLYTSSFTKEPPWARDFKINKELMQLNLRILHPLVWKTFLKVREMVAMKKLIDWNAVK